MRTILLIGALFLFSIANLTAQNSGHQTLVRIAFYNVENFFDAEQDSTIPYTQFNPGGDHHWNIVRYLRKQHNIYKVLAAMGAWKGLSLIGLAEIENQKTLSDLIKNTPFKNESYQIIHYDSPDKRGIDVGLLYRPKDFKPLFSKPVHVFDPLDSNFFTRDILYVKGILLSDTVHIFINHWTSRYGGLMQTIPKRLLAAKRLIYQVDSICKTDPRAKILVIGDFNENPGDPAVKTLTDSLNNPFPLVKVNAYALFGNARGTIKSGPAWKEFDQLYISKSLTGRNAQLFVKAKSFHIFDAKFLLEKDEKNLGFKPNRSYLGFKYHGGFSDHLPVFFDVVKKSLKQP